MNRADTEWIEKAIAEDLKRGQLEKGTSDWGFTAFLTKENAAYKAIKRGRWMVVDYRERDDLLVNDCYKDLRRTQIPLLRKDDDLQNLNHSP